MSHLSRFLVVAAAVAAFTCIGAPPADAAVISVGAFPDLAPAPSISIPSGTFLVPIEVTGADGLDTWVFDLTFDPAVVEVVDLGDGTSGLYGAEFTPGSATSMSFILGGFPFNSIGLVDDVAGAYPFSLDGQTGHGVLAYILFRFHPGHENDDPTFTVPGNPTPVPEPGTLGLIAAACLVRAFGRRATQARIRA
jgi:hypothetical protein